MSDSGKDTSIDWEGFAKSNNLSPEEFTREIFLTALSLGAMLISAKDEDVDQLKYTRESDTGDKVELTIKMIPKN